MPSIFSEVCGWKKPSRDVRKAMRRASKAARRAFLKELSKFTQSAHSKVYYTTHTRSQQTKKRGCVIKSAAIIVHHFSAGSDEESETEPETEIEEWCSDSEPMAEIESPGDAEPAMMMSAEASPEAGARKQSSDSTSTGGMSIDASELADELNKIVPTLSGSTDSEHFRKNPRSRGKLPRTLPQPPPSPAGSSSSD
jgi:hypothetical protein